MTIRLMINRERKIGEKDANDTSSNCFCLFYFFSKRVSRACLTPLTSYTAGLPSIQWHRHCRSHRHLRVFYTAMGIFDMVRGTLVSSKSDGRRWLTRSLCPITSRQFETQKWIRVYRMHWLLRAVFFTAYDLTHHNPTVVDPDETRPRRDLEPLRWATLGGEAL